MKISPAIRHLIAPSPTTLLFGFKGVIAVGLALNIAFYLQLERPFWAVVAAMMLQGRPQMGLVIEKSMMLVAATVCGGLIAFFILESFVHHPALVIATLAGVTFICTYFGSAHRHANYSYGFALIPVTASIVVFLAGAEAAHISSRSVFDIFISRLSEVSVGALSASLCSALIMPSKISDILNSHIRTATTETIEMLGLAFDSRTDSGSVRALKHKVLSSLTQILDESRAAALEGDDRGTAILANECAKLAFLAQPVLRIRHRLTVSRRAVFEAIAAELNQLAIKLRNDPLNVTTNSFSVLPLLAHADRLTQSEADQELKKIINKIGFHIRYLLCAEKDILVPARTKPKPRFAHDTMANGIIGLRVATYITVSSLLWILSGGTSSQVMMIIIPLLFAQLFGNAPNPGLAVKKLVVGAVLAIPIGTFWALHLLSWGTGDIQILYLVFMSPLFVALMAMTHPISAPYAIAFCFTYILMVQPDNRMAFDFYNSLSLGLGVIIGLCLLYMCTAIVPQPNPKRIQHNTLRYLEKQARKFSLGQTASDVFESRSQGAILHITRHSTTNSKGRLTLARALDIHSRSLDKEPPNPSLPND